VTNILELANQYAEAGLSVIPIMPDGSKRPACEWSPFQKEIAGPNELQAMFNNGRGIAIVAGRVSGSLEVMDFDAPEAFKQFCQAVKDKDRADLLKQLVAVKTPRGWHLYYRCEGEIAGNQKLAQTVNGDQRIKTLVETRGEGGYVLTVGCPAACHPSGKTYQLKRGNLLDPPLLTAKDRNFLLSMARSLNGYHRPESEHKETMESGGGRPGDEFNETASWVDVLGPHGWKKVGAKGEEEHWRRPGKNEGISATVNYKDFNLLYVFSTNTPFETEHGYSKFSAHALLNFNGDFQAAARALAAQKPKTKASGYPTLTAAVRDYIESIEGTFLTSQLCSDLDIREPRDKTNVRKILNRLKGTQILPHGNRAGSWCYVPVPMAGIRYPVSVSMAVGGT